MASECIQKRVVRYDKSGDSHYDTISAFIKSMRGSDPDAAVYYLARMLYAGEDVKFIARRIMICASEDVGNADPQALQVAVAAAQAVERIGMPESQLILSQAALYVATAPKSNSATNAIFDAMEAVKQRAGRQFRRICRTAITAVQQSWAMESVMNMHMIFQSILSHQQYLPDGLTDRRFYVPSENGYEKTIRRYLDWIHDKEE